MKTIFAAMLLSAATAAAQVPAGQTPAAPGQAPQAPPGTPVQPVAPPKPAPAGPAPSANAARTFSAPVGLLFNTVRPDKVADFEKLIASVRAALAASSDPKIKEQAKGWRFFKAAEPGPNNTVLYVFVIDPTVPGEDYGLGRVLSQGSTDATTLQEIWKLYTSSVTGGGSLLNLSPIPEPASDAAASPDAATPAPETKKP
jgi:hypothetical protein